MFVAKFSNVQYYSIAMGKLNPAKLANFMEIDIFVLVSCPENSLIDTQVLCHYTLLIAETHAYALRIFTDPSSHPLSWK